MYTLIPRVLPQTAHSSRRQLIARVLAFTAALFASQLSASAATLPTGFTETQIASGLASPTAMAIAPDGRIFITLQGGAIRVVKNNALLSTPFITLPVSSSGERGVLGITFDPNFATNRFVYVYYTATSPTIHNRLSRFTANGDVAVSGSEVQLMNFPTLSATNHNGGALHFGTDGKLYVAIGDNAVGSNSQSTGTVLGKILRINSDGSIPTDNPFYGSTSGNNRAIWAMGLRNPFNFAFDPSNGTMFINDVGQNTWEEVNRGARGANYGWPTTEGPTSDTRFVSPYYSYNHSTGGCSIIGAAFYRPATVQFPSAYVGQYFFGDYCAGYIRRLNPTNGTVTNFATGLSALVDLRVSADGSLYYLSRGSGSNTGVLYRVRYTSAPGISTQPQSQTVSVGQSVTFSVTATGTAPLTYQWQRNGTNISGATSASHTFNAAATDNGATYRVIVTNSAGSATSNSATLTVNSAPNPNAPVATITTPATGTLYSGGMTLSFAGTGTDTEDGTLPASRFTWEIVFHHDTHTHPFYGPTSGITSGSVTIPTEGETASNVFYRIHLTVTDSGGRTHTSTRDVNPRTVAVTLASNPTGLQLTLDGQPVTAPHTFTGVVGVIRNIGAVSPQTFGGQNYNFQSWSQGGAATQVISTPATASTYTATFTTGAAPVDVVYQAENATPGGTNPPVVEPTNTGYRGTGYVNFALTASTLTFNNVNGNGGGAKNLTVRFANGGTAARTGTVTVNGVTTSVTFPTTGTWTTWQTISVPVTLNNSSTNTIQFASTGGDLGNMDEISIPPTSPAGPTLQAENAALAGGTIAESTNAGYNGSGYANSSASGGTITFTNISGNGGGTKTLAIRFANGGSTARAGNLVVNGSTTSISFPTTGSWTTWQLLNVNITLNNTNTNTIQFASTGSDLANIDQIALP
jgi:glucose/arabinose dehydrogenase